MPTYCLSESHLLYHHSNSTVPQHGAQWNTFGTHPMLLCCGKIFNEIEMKKL